MTDLTALSGAIRRRGDVLNRIVGQPFPGQPGHRIGTCGHAIPDAGWDAGQHLCGAAYCGPTPPKPQPRPAKGDPHETLF